jgi:hypothetical protein
MAYRHMQIERIGRAFSLLLSPMVVGCAAEAIDLEQFSENLCDGSYQMLGAVEPAQTVDYLELRSAVIHPWDEEPSFGQPDVLDATGTRCSGASDSPACESQFDALELESEFVRYGFDASDQHLSLGYTRGDDVDAVRSAASLDAFLGSIDAPGDAALLATLRGHKMVCDGENDVGARGSGFVLHTRTGGGCGQGDDIKEHVVLVRPDGQIEVIETVLIEKGDPGCAVGRLPAGLCRRRPRRRATSPVGEFFAEVAHLEAAAVAAFGQLSAELRLHGAPRGLVTSSRRAIHEERRHARVMARLARRYGGRPVAPRIQPVQPRSLANVAIDNAAEGCIRETYGALVAMVQSRRARDPVVKQALGGIARDELRHAALSWDLAQWARTSMNASERRRVRRAEQDALERLETELTGPQPESVCRAAGMPDPDEARRLFVGLRDGLLASAPVSHSRA